jgi:hypothetical protein
MKHITHILAALIGCAIGFYLLPREVEYVFISEKHKEEFQEWHGENLVFRPDADTKEVPATFSF